MRIQRSAANRCLVILCADSAASCVAVRVIDTRRNESVIALDKLKRVADPPCHTAGHIPLRPFARGDSAAWVRRVEDLDFVHDLGLGGLPTSLAGLGEFTLS